MQEGLSEVLKAENGVVDKDKEHERNKELTKVQMEAFLKNNKGKKKLDMKDLVQLGAMD